MDKEQIRELFEKSYADSIDAKVGQYWNQTYRNALDKGLIKKEQYDEYTARGFVYLNSSIDNAWNIYLAGFWAGASAEFSYA